MPAALRAIRTRALVALALLFVATPSARAHENEPPPVVKPAPPPPPPETPQEVVVSGDKALTASSHEARARDLKLRPRVRVGDVFSVVPGLLVVQHAGGGKAYQYFIRGFDADHGTDIAIAVDGVPVNQPSHAHGQGWIDPHFIIPELVRTVSSVKGPYSAAHGDFAVAGAVDLGLVDHVHQSSVMVEGGSFGSARTVFIAAPELGEDWSTIVAGELATTNGPFLNPERFRKLNVFGRATRHLGPGKLAFTWMSYGGSWNASGQIPLRAVGKVPELPDAYGAIDPTDGGGSQRHQLSISYGYHQGNDEARALVYLIRQHLDLFSNFTFFANDPVRGDQIAQSDGRTVIGAHWYHRRRTTVGSGRGSMQFVTTVGFQGRHDTIDTTLYRTQARALLEPTVDAEIAQSTVGVYVEEDARLLPWLRTVVGARADRMDVRVRDNLPREGAAPSGSGIASAMALSPKLSLILSPARALDLFLSYGRGFHSNDARGAVRRADPRDAPATLIAPADSYEVGTRLRPLDGVELGAALFRMDLASEIVWVGDEGTTEARGATRRIGLELDGRVKLLKWLFADVDVTFVRPRFVESGPSESAIALAPTRMMSAGLGFKHPKGTFGSLRVRSLADRPATEDRTLTAEGWTVVDASIGHRFEHLEVAIDARNLVGSAFREVQFANESQLRGEPAPVRDLHFTPGPPRMVLARATVLW